MGAEPSALSEPQCGAFHDTVSALVYALAQCHAKPDDDLLRAPFNDLTRFVLQQHSRLPDYLRAPLEAATLGFDLLGFLATATRFHSQSPNVRSRQVARWKKSRIAFCRDLMRYHESLSTRAIYRRMTPRNQSSSSPLDRHDVLERPEPELRCEIAVIGSGPGGAISACLLAEAGRDVLLLEEGPYYELESCQPFSVDEMVQKYRNGGQTVALGRNKIAYVEGRCVGGGSEINSGLYHRTPSDILELWRKDFAVEAISEKELAPHFEASEKELSVSFLPGAAPPASLKLHEGATRLGWKSVEIPRWFHYGEKTGQGTRQSMTKTFVPRFLKSGGRLLSNTRVERLRSEGGRWDIRAKHRSQSPLRIMADTVFVCAGAVQTPTILRRSGISENIGNSLQLHPTIKLVAKFAEDVNSAEMGVPVHQVKEFAPRLSFGCSISSPPYVALGLLDHAAYAQRTREDWRQLAVYYAMITGEGRGTVRTLPKFSDTLVRYELADADRRDLAEGLRKLAHILFESGAQAIYPGVSGCPVLANANELRRLPDVVPHGLGNLMTIHLFSSCPMGEHRSKCAADSFGRLHGFNNLFVADASLLCSAPGVNPQGSIMAFARRNVLHFLKR
jgi:choline dehydrogenase-like flavoprotein